jgi:Domain of unknown function (DUF5666)
MTRYWSLRSLASAFTLTMTMILTLSGCGGVDSGGTGGSSAVGPISGLGSIIVNGVRFDDSTALVTDDDGQPLSRSRLKLGVLVSVDGSTVSMVGGERIASASRIRVSSDLVGTIQAIDTQNRTVTVLQQTVRVTAATVFDDLLPLRLDSLSPGQTVEVYGRADPTSGRYVATRIELRAHPSFHVIRGRVDAVGNGTATIGSAVLDVSGLSVADAALIVPGRVARLRLEPSTLRAISAAQGERTLSDSEESFLEGRITRFDSATSFEVDGQPVDATRAAFPNGSGALGLGQRVSVEGTSRGGVLVAAEIEIEEDEDSSTSLFELHGAIEVIDTTSRSLQVRGVVVDYSGGVVFDGGVEADLAVGRRIEVKGTLQTGGVGLSAQEIKFESD